MNELPVSLSKTMRDMILRDGYLNVEEFAKAHYPYFATDPERGITNARSLFHQEAVRHRVSKETGKMFKREGQVFRLVDMPSETPQPIEDAVPKQNARRSVKTAVLVVRETRDESGPHYELDVVGELNRNMMKEALKQLMEVFI